MLGKGGIRSDERAKTDGHAPAHTDDTHTRGPMKCQDVRRDFVDSLATVAWKLPLSRTLTYGGVGVADPHGAEEVHPAAPHEAEDGGEEERIVLAGNVPGENEKPDKDRNKQDISGSRFRSTGTILAFSLWSLPPPSFLPTGDRVTQPHFQRKLPQMNESSSNAVEHQPTRYAQRLRQEHREPSLTPGRETIIQDGATA